LSRQLDKLNNQLKTIAAWRPFFYNPNPRPMPRKPPESPELSLANFWSQPKNKKQKTAKDTTNKICDNVDLQKKSPIKKTPIQEVTKQLFPIEDAKKVVVLSNIELQNFRNTLTISLANFG
jgi:hypothetical protein